MHWIAKITPKASPDTAKSYINAIRFFHVENDLSTIAFGNPRIDLVIRGAKWVYRVGVKKLHFPLTASILLQIINGTGCDEEGINVKMAICHLLMIWRIYMEFSLDQKTSQHLPLPQAHYFQPQRFSNSYPP